MSGRGFGKTRTGAELVRKWAYEGRTPIALIGQTKADVRDTMIELGDSSILRISPPWFRPEYEPSKRRLLWPNGVIAIAYSGDEPDQLRGPQHAGAWLDEIAKFKYPQETWDNLEFGLRIGKSPQVIVTSTPRPIEIVRNLIADKRTVLTKASTFENACNLPASFLQRLKDKYEGTTLGRQELEGEILNDIPGALWRREIILRKDVPRDSSGALLTNRIVVAIDPAVTSGENSDETGIVAAAKGKDGNYYVLADRSGRMSPRDWALTAVRLFNELKADRIIAEANNGGDMVELTLRTVAQSIPFKKVNASHGKRARAEPISALYEQGKVFHSVRLPTLEDQMCCWTGEDSEKSPDRMDALVWALSELSTSGTYNYY